MKVPLTFGPPPWEPARIGAGFQVSASYEGAGAMMSRGLMWWTLGIPLPVITAVYLFHVL
jgi:hypothetical protein